MQAEEQEDGFLKKYGIDALCFLSLQDVRRVFESDSSHGERLKNRIIAAALTAAQPVTREHALQALNRIRRPKVLEHKDAMASYGMAMGACKDEAVEAILAQLASLAQSGRILLLDTQVDRGSLPIELDADIGTQLAPPRLVVVGGREREGVVGGTFNLHEASPQDAVDFWLPRTIAAFQHGTVVVEHALDEVVDPFSRHMLELCLDEISDTELRQAASEARRRDISALRHKLGMARTAFMSIAGRDLSLLASGDPPVPTCEDIEAMISAIEHPRIPLDQDEGDFSVNLHWLARRALRQGTLSLEEFVETIQEPFCRWGLAWVTNTYHLDGLPSALANRIDAIAHAKEVLSCMVEEFCLGMRNEVNPDRVLETACSYLPRTLSIEGMEYRLW